MRFPTCLLILVAIAVSSITATAGPNDMVQDGIESVEEGIDWIQKRRTFTMNGEPYGLTGLPIIFYSQASGFHYGGWIEVANYKVRPYNWRVNVQWWLSTAGKRNHHIRVEYPTMWSLPFSVRFLTQDLKNIRANFFGLGNSTSINKRQLEQQPDYYSYGLEQQRSAIDIEANGAYGVSFFSGLRFNRGVPTRIDQTESNYYVFRGTDAEVPGRTAGWSNFFIVGVILDRRNDPDLTTSGVLTELSYQKSYEWLGSDYLFDRYTFINAHYYPIKRWYVLVNLTVIEFLNGDAPFYELTEIGGSIRGFSVGGSATLRGFESRRFADKQKFLWTTELRRLFRSRKWFGQYLQTQAVVWADLGRVAPKLSDLSPLGVHYSGGAGFRATWNAQLTVRVDYAISTEDRRVLLNFGNLF